jgi:hypothetical protein
LDSPEYTSIVPVHSESLEKLVIDYFAVGRWDMELTIAQQKLITR